MTYSIVVKRRGIVDALRRQVVVALAKHAPTPGRDVDPAVGSIRSSPTSGLVRARAFDDTETPRSSSGLLFRGGARKATNSAGERVLECQRTLSPQREPKRRRG
jgi:hypothetical protein